MRYRLAPKALRFISAEPLLGPVDLQRVQWPRKHQVDVLRGGAWELEGWPGFTNHSDMATIDWVIVGGESGPGARPFDIGWGRGLVEQCKAAGVPCFVKQLGARPFSFDDQMDLRLADRKGGDPEEWPDDLRVREFPSPDRAQREGVLSPAPDPSTKPGDYHRLG